MCFHVSKWFNGFTLTTHLQQNLLWWLWKMGRDTCYDCHALNPHVHKDTCISCHSSLWCWGSTRVPIYVNRVWQCYTIFPPKQCREAEPPFVRLFACHRDLWRVQCDERWFGFSMLLGCCSIARLCFTYIGTLLHWHTNTLYGPTTLNKNIAEAKKKERKILTERWQTTTAVCQILSLILYTPLQNRKDGDESKTHFHHTWLSN